MIRILIAGAVVVALLGVSQVHASEDPPGHLGLVYGAEVGSPPTWARFWLDQPRLDYYLDLEIDVLDLRGRIEIKSALPESQARHIAVLERRCAVLERQANHRTGLYLLGVGTGFVITVVAVILGLRGIQLQIGVVP